MTDEGKVQYVISHISSVCFCCGWDFNEPSNSLTAEGAPCGVHGCTDYHCCHKAWEDHVKDDHKLDPNNLKYGDDF